MLLSEAFHSRRLGGNRSSFFVSTSAIGPRLDHGSLVAGCAALSPGPNCGLGRVALTNAPGLRALHRRGSAELIALLWCDQLMVGQALLVQRRLLLLDARLGTFTLRLLLGHSRTLLGYRRAPLTIGGFLPVLLDDPLTPLIQFALAHA